MSRPRPEPYRLPREVDRATEGAGESWPHVLAESLRGGQPFRPLPLPATPFGREVPTSHIVAAALVLYGLAAWLL